MKNILGPTLVAASLCLASLPAQQAPQTWTGRISDSMCGASHQAKAGALTERECIFECLKSLAKYVLVDQNNKALSFDARGTGFPRVQGSSVDIGAFEVQVPATVSSVTSTTADGSYGVGSVITLTVGFSKSVTVTGTPQLALNSSGTASYSSGSGTSTLSFTYTVQADHEAYLQWCRKRHAKYSVLEEPYETHSALVDPKKLIATDACTVSLCSF